jgi:hypothetical protein
MPGPPPKRDVQRRRVNPPAKGPADKATSDGMVRGPKLIGTHSAVGRRFWVALQSSGQAQFFEPSDWAAAELVVLAIDSFVRKPSSMMLAAIQTGMTNLLVTEGDRRRARLELERLGSEGGEGDVSWLDDARRRLRGEGAS